jgi:hypothetical protein
MGKTVLFCVGRSIMIGLEKLFERMASIAWRMIFTAGLPYLYLRLDVDDHLPAFIKFVPGSAIGKHFHIPARLFRKHVEKVWKIDMRQIGVH